MSDTASISSLTLVTDDEETDDDGSTQSSEPYAIVDEAETIVNELIRIRREDKRASPAAQHTLGEYMELTEILTNMIAHDPALDMADYNTTWRYVGLYHSLQRASLVAAQVFLTALCTGRPSLDQESPLQAMQGQSEGLAAQNAGREVLRLLLVRQSAAMEAAGKQATGATADANQQARTTV